MLMIHPYLMLREPHKVTEYFTSAFKQKLILCIDWDGTPSKYLTPHGTPDVTSHKLVLLPSR